MLTAKDIAIVLLDFGIILGISRFLGEIARRYHQPMVIGELLTGILLGPTVFGALAPEIQHSIFPMSGSTLNALEGMTTVAVVLLLLVAGMEIHLSSILRQGRTALWVSVFGIIVPFVLGFGSSQLWPHFLGFYPESDLLTFSLFFGTALSISALPVIVKILLDINLLKSDMGILVISSAAFNDLIGWIIFSIILSLMGGGTEHGLSPLYTILFTTLFIVFLLTVLRWAFHSILPWLERKTVWPGGILGFIFAIAMLGASVTQWLGVHAVLGAFIVGIALGDSSHPTERTKEVISQFTMNIFAPLFFGFVGLQVDFAANFDILLVLFVFALACAGKIVGCALGARWGGLSSREALAVGFGMNARGAMGIILGLLALEYGLIHENLFVALVVMAIGTSMLSGPVMEWILREKKPLKFANLLKPSNFTPSLSSTTREDVIMELAKLASRETGIETHRIFTAVWTREKIMGTAIGSSIAVPNAHLIEISAPVVVAGLSQEGIDFNAIDGAPVRLIFMLLTPTRDEGAQLQILDDITRVFSNIDTRNSALLTRDYKSFMDAIGQSDGQ